MKISGKVAVLKLSVRLAVIFVLSMLLFVTGCRRAEKEQIETVVGNVKTFQSISISLQGVIKVIDHGVERSGSADFNINAVPITWNGSMFYGSTYEDDSNRIADDVHGIISEDGQWIETLQFSQMRVGGEMMGIMYSVTLTNVPVAEVNAENQTVITGIFSRIGGVGKFVKSVEYEQKGVQYVSMDWLNLAQPSSLNVTFSEDPGHVGKFAPPMPM